MGLKVARTKEFDVQIGRNIKAIRTRAGLTQETLGESLGVSFQQIQKKAYPVRTGVNHI